MAVRPNRALSIRRRIAFALATLMLPIMAIGGVAMWAIDSSTARFELAAEEQIADSLAIIRLRDQLITAEWWAMQYANEGQRSAKGRYLALVPEIEGNLDRILDMDAPSELELANQIDDAWAIAGPVGMSAIEARPGSTETAEIYPLEEFHPAMEEGIGLLEDLNEASLRDMGNDVREIEVQRTQMIFGLSIVLLITLVGAVVLSRRLRSVLIIPLKKLEDAARRFGDHDFEHRVDVATRDEFGQVAEAFNAMASRISEGQAESESLEKQLRHQALHDSLTGLANRVLFANRVEHAIRSLGRSRTRIGVLFVDVDDFKSVNDSLGHDAGDEVLVDIGQRVQSCVRAGDTVARFGGDEFAILLSDLDDIHDAQTIADRILEAMTMVFMVGDEEMRVRASVGVAVSQDVGISGDELLRRADLAMYAAKAGGKERALLFEPYMDDDFAGKAKLKRELFASIERNELTALYQPVVDLPAQNIAGAEALVRWNHPTEGLLTPDQFLPIAERSGFIVDIDRWMLKTACAQVASWNGKLPEGFSISVNVSGESLRQDDLVTHVAATLRETGLPPHQLVLEITEHALVDTGAAHHLADLKKLGVRLAIDDFGTGYSAINYLRRFPIDILKIDKSFVDNVVHERDASLAKAIVGLASALHLTTVAEGIEQQEQAGSLSDFGVGQGQGYLFARPMPAEDLQLELRRPSATLPEKKERRLQAS
jgi:diguanylate cyclase (GGDEF)-like protein